MAKFDISRFQSIVSKRGLLKTNKFRVEIPIPQGMLRADEAQVIARDLEMYADGAVLPMVDITTSDIRRHGYGASEKRAHGANFQDIPVRFLADGHGSVWDFFKAWENLIVNFDSAGGPMDKNGGKNVPYEVSYKEDYAVDLNIYCYDDYGREAIKVTLLEAWPTRLEEISMDWNNQNEVTHVLTMWTYRDWHADTINTSGQLRRENVADLLTRVIRNVF